MDILPKLLTNVLPLYGFIGVGYAASRWFGLKDKWISWLLLYLLIPVVIFEHLIKAELAQMAIVAVMIFMLAVLMNLPAWLVGKFLVKDINKYQLNCSFSYYNIGWFGIPVVMALFGQEQMPLIMSAYMGNVFYGDTIGYFLISRSKDLPVSEAVKNVLKIPAVYACVAAVIANLLGFELPEALSPVMKGASWTLSALGMIMIGIGLSKANLRQLDYKKYGKLVGSRFLGSVILMGLLVLAEAAIIGQLESDEQKLMLLLSVFPIAANLVVFSSFLDTEQESAALLVATSSLISLLLVPIVSLLLF
ncbi:AEC family transporter [Pontibacter beigongshangensis]|uniref:AEC family transporter n=1 Tax=Pontibacter beigongshangensis TaxID=2574733 RepID=UPI00164EE4B9|nr:AEC family transporter [Pontibacter beigongshangensis]